IQPAVNFAGNGYIISVNAGTYTEQVAVPGAKSGLKLKANGAGVTIAAPAVMTSPKAIVRIRSSQNVLVDGFTITGPGGGGCDSLEEGVRVDSGGSAKITNDHILNIADSPL